MTQAKRDSVIKEATSSLRDSARHQTANDYDYWASFEGLSRAACASVFINSVN